MKKEIKIYTDGAAKGNPGRAGWAAIILFGQDEGASKCIETGGRVDHATNNQMELTGPIEALKHLNKFCVRQDLAQEDLDIEIISDSKYVILGITEWIFNWQKNNWRNAAKKPVLNQALWEELYKLTQPLKIKWTYVKGHNGNKYNERADVIASSFAEGEEIELKK